MYKRQHEQREHALLWRQLSTIACDAPLPDGDFARGPADAQELQALMEWLRFGPMTRRRLQQAGGLEAQAA